MIDERKRAAQELIAGIYGRLCSLRDADKEATAIVLPPDSYRLLQEYRNNLGEVPAGLPDYLGRYDLFGIPLYTDTRTDVVIKSRRSKDE
ncbi:MAG: hypothetical protein PF508_05410 [Spirochaeta sp.]|jgi:hypothetical protein|nr:hypothetical protein [Spirochaeta sp.]